MIIEKTNIDDVKLIKPKIYNDSRGYFFESFNQELSKSLNCDKMSLFQHMELSVESIFKNHHLNNQN